VGASAPLRWTLAIGNPNTANPAGWGAIPIGDATTIRVWDPFVGLFHWALALSFAVAWIREKTNE
jgi:hypothetical protein